MLFMFHLLMACVCCFFFFFQAEDGIRDLTVTGVQTCALPISVTTELNAFELFAGAHHRGLPVRREMEAAGIALRGLEILPLTRVASLKGAAIVSSLRSRGQDIGALDVLVAAIALTHGVDTIVTRDAAHFRRVPGFRVETY